MKRSTIAIVLLALAFVAAPRLESLAAPTSSSSASAQQAANTLIVPLAAQNGSNQTGSATLTAAGQKTNVVIALNGATPDAVEPAHVHQGTCAKLNPKPAYPLSSVTGGSSTTTLNVPLSSLETGGFAINVHESMTNISKYVACGNIPAATNGSTTTTTTTSQPTAPATTMPTSPPK
ncbi:MAG TPA: hypothetical protein VEV38_05095 [Candidatus Eremiobacteraceae bacterium]|nr:hypothetical protein [Candidatus Eremiobacteraceae bacterium]